MMGSRYRNTRRPPWPHNNNSERWQPHSNVSSFGYRRHELADKPSTSTFRENTSEEAPAYGESYTDTCFRRQSRDHSQSQNSYDSDSGDNGPYCPPSNARHSVETDYEIHDLVKAASDTDFRFSSSPHRCEEERRQFPNRNPYRTVPNTAQEQRPLVPILKKNNTFNPWKEEGGGNDATRRDLTPAHPHNANRGSPHSGPLQRAPNAVSTPSRGLLPVPNLARLQTPPTNSCPDSISGWDTPPTQPRGNHGYFEALRQREQERNMFGKSHGPQSTFQREQPPVGHGGSSQTLAFSSSSNAPTFSNYGNRDADAHPSQNATSPGGGHHAGIQGTWRGRAGERGKLSSSGRGARRSRQRTPPCQRHGRRNGASAEGAPKSAASRMTHCGVDARLILDRKRKCASEEGSVESIPLREDQPALGTSPDRTQLSSKMALMERLHHDTKRWVEDQPAVGTSPGRTQLSSKMAPMETLQRDTKRWVEDKPAVGTSPGRTQLLSKMALMETLQHDTKRWVEDKPAVGTSPGRTQLSSKMALMETLQHDTKRWVENHFSENDPALSHTPDVHEVDESRLWPPDVSPEAVSYVIFLDIDRRSFFDEAKQPFLPGTLLYLFYGDPSVLLPTKEHPFYKVNKGNWVHFYPDCGTEYGSYLVAAPAVISWMNQKVPQGVKFLVHGHQKQLNLDDVLRRILFYPTSRTMDIPLLNRMLRGDFDIPKTPKAAAPTAIKTIVIRSTTAKSPPPQPPKSKPLPNLANKNIPVRPPPPRRQAPGSDSSGSDRAPPALLAKSPMRAQKHPPILAPGQEPSKEERVTRQKILWDL